MFLLQLKSLIQSADPGADYRIDRALNEACESVIQTACKHIRSGDPMWAENTHNTHTLFSKHTSQFQMPGYQLIIPGRKRENKI